MRTGIAKSVAATAAAIAAFVPIGRCPACFASATGVAGSIGLTGLASSPWFLLLIGAFLSAGLWGMAASASAHRRWSGLWAGAVGAILLLAGRIVGDAHVVWAGAALLTVAFVLDLYWKRKASVARLVRIAGID